MCFSPVSLASDVFYKTDGCSLGFNQPPSKTWSGAGKPPIDISDVTQVFQNWVSKLPNQQQYSFHVVGYYLSAAAIDVEPYRHWVYRIDYAVFKGNVPVEPFRRFVGVTLDSQILEADCEDRL